MSARRNKEQLLHEIFLKYTGICFKKSSDLKNEKLFGAKISLSPRDMLLLMLCIEKEFCIKIPKHIITSNHFDCYNNIMKIVENQVF
ncbi:MAG: peptide maturation system acyl carrier-related protein [Oscillospiraceae bacterium]|nr:peptide maturation system acyl carrier-related protein [Oscillospiraceae bacterium]